MFKVCLYNAARTDSQEGVHPFSAFGIGFSGITLTQNVTRDSHRMPSSRLYCPISDFSGRVLLLQPCLLLWSYARFHVDVLQAHRWSIP